MNTFESIDEHRRATADDEPRSLAANAADCQMRSGPSRHNVPMIVEFRFAADQWVLTTDAVKRHGLANAQELLMRLIEQENLRRAEALLGG